MARYYSPTYDPSGYNAGPTYDVFGNNTDALQSTDNSDTDIQGEEIPCTGELIIDFDDIIGNRYYHYDPDWGVQWNIPDHMNNTSTHNGVEPFVSFYIMNSNGDFVTDDSKVVDEVFILYHPDSVISDATIEWACGFYDTNPLNQVAVGTVLFIDQNGLSGTAGPDNCDTVQELDNEEFCCIFYIATTSDSGGCDDCIDPTFYYSQNKFIVKDGFRYNDYSTNVTAKHTPTPLLLTNTTQVNYLILKVYDNFGTGAIEWIDVGFGTENMFTPLLQAEVVIKTKFSNNEIVSDYPKITDLSNLINFGEVTASVVNCGIVDTSCLEITIPHAFRDNLLYPGITIGTTDESGNNKYHYLNDGLEIQGKSLNESPTDKIFIQKYLGDPSPEWVDIVRIDRVNDIWSSEDGMEFKGTDGGGFQRITPLGFDNTLID